MENHQIKNYLVGITLLFLFSACVKDDLYNTPHPDRGALQIHTDWSALTSDAVQPANYQLRVGELTQTGSGTNNTFNSLFSEGAYTLLVHNVPSGVTVGSTTATVNTLPNGTLEPCPDYLFSAIKALQIVKDDTFNVNVKMIQSLRTLQLRLTLKAGDEARIASIDATLTGILSVVDLGTGAVEVTDAGKTVKPLFQLVTGSPTRAATTPALVSLLRLAGVADTGKQLLTVIVALKDGTTQTIETDLTSWLKNFSDKTAPLTLDAALELAKQPEMGGVIKDWDVVENGNFPIH